LDDYRKLIAAGKAQRWEVLKWTVTVNLALATASIALRRSTDGSTTTSGGFLSLAFFVAVIGALLILYYNDRMTKARNESVRIAEYLIGKGLNYAAISGKEPTRIGFWYDLEDLALFGLILGLFVVIVWLI
jgi:hypothetical protein